MSAIYKVARTVAKHPGVYRSAVNTNPVRSYGGFAPSRRYKVGHTTRAHLGSMGIFCFDNSKSAVAFARKADDVILMVEGIGERAAPEKMDELFNCPHLRPTLMTRSIPEGTICYPAVKVLSVWDFRGEAGG